MEFQLLSTTVSQNLFKLTSNKKRKVWVLNQFLDVEFASKEQDAYPWIETAVNDITFYTVGTLCSQGFCQPVLPSYVFDHGKHWDTFINAFSLEKHWI